MSASYPSAIKSFTTKTDGSGQTIFAAHINDLQDEIVAMETALVTGPVVLPAVTLTGGQIAFPAAQVASANVNTLDDYEEGTWTPSLGGTATYTTQTGTYTKIGNRVFVQGHLTINVIGSGSTGAISGLPFAISGSQAGHIGYFSASANNFVFVGCFGSGSVINITTMAAAANGTANPGVFFGNGTDVYFAINYTV